MPASIFWALLCWSPKKGRRSRGTPQSKDLLNEWKRTPSNKPLNSTALTLKSSWNQRGWQRHWSCCRTARLIAWSKPASSAHGSQDDDSTDPKHHYSNLLRSTVQQYLSEVTQSSRQYTKAAIWEAKPSCQHSQRYADRPNFPVFSGKPCSVICIRCAELEGCLLERGKARKHLWELQRWGCKKSDGHMSFLPHRNSYLPLMHTVMKILQKTSR